MKHRSAVLCGQARVVHSVSECVSTSMRRYFEVETADPRGACKYSKKKTEESVWGLSVKAAGAWISSTRVALTQGETSVP